MSERKNVDLPQPDGPIIAITSPFFTVVLIFSILMATLAGCDKADKVSDTTKKPVIKIGSDNYPPYNFLNEDGIPTGIDVELATEAFRRMGYKTEIVQINWEKKKELVESGKIDCIMGCFSMDDLTIIVGPDHT